MLRAGDGWVDGEQGARGLLDQLGVLAQKHFSIPSLNENQKTVFLALQNCNHALITMPTGSGKTLIYALLACVQPPNHVTLVISPLIALMRDQVSRMKSAGISADLLSSDQDESEKLLVLQNFSSQKTKMLFVSPERAFSRSFLSVLKKIRIGLFVIDEAHCIVSWGSFFRPEYSEISHIYKQINPIKTIALTATASKIGRIFIKKTLFLNAPDYKEITFPPLNKNIFIQFSRVYSEKEKIELLIHEIKNSTFRFCVVYLPKRELCDSLAKHLREQNIHAVAYHAGLSKEQRLACERYLKVTKKQTVICATIAFGMGIDLSGLDLALIHGFPASLEDYLQMIGRVGRGHTPGKSVVIWSGSDPKKRYAQLSTAMPNREAVTKDLGSLCGLFPGDHQSKLIHLDRLQQVIEAANLGKRWSFEKLLGLLRLLGKANLSLLGEPAIQVTFKTDRSLELARFDLPAGPTKRRFFLDALGELTSEKFKSIKGATAAVSIGEILDNFGGGTWAITKQVLDYFSREEILTYEVYSERETRHMFVLTGSLFAALENLEHYENLRGFFFSSLNALSKVANSQTCRAKSIESFFSSKGFATSKEDAGSCGRCDLCLSKSETQIFRRPKTFNKGLEKW